MQTIHLDLLFNIALIRLDTPSQQLIFIFRKPPLSSPLDGVIIHIISSSMLRIENAIISRSVHMAMNLDLFLALWLLFTIHLQELNDVEGDRLTKDRLFQS
jgi:hypothetical protein